MGLQEGQRGHGLREKQGGGGWGPAREISKDKKCGADSVEWGHESKAMTAKPEVKDEMS